MRGWSAVLAAVAVLAVAGCADTAGDGSSSAPAGSADPVAGAGLLPDVAALSPDGERLVVACPDALCLWSTSDGTLVDTWSGGSVVAWSPGGDVVATSEVSDGVAYVVLLDAEDGSELSRLEGPEVADSTEITVGGIAEVAFSSDGTVVAAAAGDGTVRLWEVGSGSEVATLDVASPAPDALAFDPSGDRLAVAGTEAPVEVFDVDDGDLTGTLDAEPQGDVVWSPDGTTLATSTREAGGEARLRLWSAPDLGETAAWRTQADQLAFSGDGRRLAYSQKNDPVVLVRSVDGGRGGQETELRTSTSPRAVLWSPDGDVVHAVAADGITSWDPSIGELVLEHDPPAGAG